MTIYNLKIIAKHDSKEIEWNYHFDTIQNLEMFVRGILAFMNAQWQGSFNVFKVSSIDIDDEGIDKEINAEEADEIDDEDLEENEFVVTFAELEYSDRDETDSVFYTFTFSRYETI